MESWRSPSPHLPPSPLVRSDFSNPPLNILGDLSQEPPLTFSLPIPHHRVGWGSLLWCLSLHHFFLRAGSPEGKGAQDAAGGWEGREQKGLPKRQGGAAGSSSKKQGIDLTDCFLASQRVLKRLPPESVCLFYLIAYPCQYYQLNSL